MDGRPMFSPRRKASHISLPLHESYVGHNHKGRQATCHYVTDTNWAVCTYIPSYLGTYV